MSPASRAASLFGFPSFSIDGNEELKILSVAALNSFFVSYSHLYKMVILLIKFNSLFAKQLIKKIKLYFFRI
jgi:hypothetical protein